VTVAEVSGKKSMDGREILSVARMYAADEAAIAAGKSGFWLMENAARAVTRAILRRWAPCPTVVLCGPGNNGGDGFGVAVGLARARWPVSAALLGERDSLTGDAARMADLWDGDVAPLSPSAITGKVLVVDALFGAGLSRPIDGVAAATLAAVVEAGLDVVAVDVPSGIQGDTGVVTGAVAPADLTVSFFRPKPAHVLSPGRHFRGEIEIADIGVPDTVLDEVGLDGVVNGPRLWGERFPWPDVEGHKYARGHAVVAGGAVMTGAARLAATAALRAGAGLVTVAAPERAFGLYSQSLTSVMVSSIAGADDWRSLLSDARKNAVLLGPGNGVGEGMREAVSTVFEYDRAMVIDADALTSFAESPETLFAAIAASRGKCLLTPHDGEFARLFDITGDRMTRAREAAKRSGATILLKGPESVIAAPDGRVAVTINGVADLASAGTGDVLAGIAVGLMAAGMDAFDAGCAAAWLHAEAGRVAGTGLIAEDLPDALPAVLRDLRYSA
jgi:NAD(P)H-hydrate epimerase